MLSGGVCDLGRFGNSRCFHPGLASRGPVPACLSTMAMGDHTAVEFGQATHSTLAAFARSILPRERLCLHSRPPREGLRYVAGVIQDSRAGLEVVPEASLGRPVPWTPRIRSPRTALPV